MKKLGFPIIHIIGLPGAGKTTLGKKLSAKYHLPVFYIGAYRSKFPSSDKGEADAWVAHRRAAGGRPSLRRAAGCGVREKNRPATHCTPAAAPPPPPPPRGCAHAAG